MKMVQMVPMSHNLEPKTFTTILYLPAGTRKSSIFFSKANYVNTYISVSAYG